ncbi:serpin peptidase inhibitor, clade B like [Bos taurus]|uniref:LOC511106 protein n=1 Tax=Bos taurus TaxID=9913 RepID=A8E4Q3_BOVIN|nr:serpin peptidase inhibitor, clade B like [Bos taurus]AAI51497.1 LOC511106 protein [Bos taurus]
MSSLSEAIIHLAIDLFHQIRKSEKENIFYSPFSISSALAMTYLGARGNTASQMQKVLHFSEIAANTKGGATKDPVEKPGNVHHHFQKLLTELKKSTDAYELSVANRLYGEKEFRFLQEYMDNVQKYYLASVESADFISAAEESQKMINSWVESQTNGRIKNLFPQNSLNSSVLVLVNAVYFKGQWQEEFKKENTVEEKFWLNKDTSKPVQMMKQTNHFKFVSLEDVQAKILEIPYTGGELSMMVLLPDEVDGLQEVEDQLTAEKLIEWTSPQNMGNREVDLYLPRFKVEESYNLVPTLQALGMVDAFCDGVANFSGMNGSRDLAVSKVIHKSFVEVTEEGTEATAATGVVITRTSLPFRERFRCDHPFLFLIKHIKTNSILFCGRVSSP